MPTHPKHSVFAQRFNIPNIESDISQWDQAWERVLPTLSALRDVFPVLSQLWQSNEPGTSAQSVAPKDLEERLCRSQELIAKLWDELIDRTFIHVWLLLSEGEQRTHLFNGIKWACEYASLGQDARALCPEITVSTMLKHNGWGFALLANNCASAVKEAGRGVNVTHLWSAWWFGGVRLPANLAEEIKFPLAALTLQRNEFIAAFILLTITSALRELNYTSPIAILVKSEDFFTFLWRNPPGPRQMRCEYCTGSAEELGRRLKFMMCGKCKANTRLPPVYYCSRPCQKADWKIHKTRCGKQGKVMSINSPRRYWTFYVPEDAQAAGIPLLQAEDIVPDVLDERSPDPSRPHSPALQRQISLLKADRDADYFLFDEADRPVCFVIPEEDKWMKMSFRLLREEAFFGDETNTQVEAIAEYLIQNMSDRPGLSRARILAQFRREYGPAKARQVVEFERKGIEEGYSVGTTFLEAMSKDMRKLVLR